MGCAPYDQLWVLLSVVRPAGCTVRGPSSRLYCVRYCQLCVSCEVLLFGCNAWGTTSCVLCVRYHQLGVFCKVLPALCVFCLVWPALCTFWGITSSPSWQPPRCTIWGYQLGMCPRSDCVYNTMRWGPGVDIVLPTWHEQLCVIY